MVIFIVFSAIDIVFVANDKSSLSEFPKVEILSCFKRSMLVLLKLSFILTFDFSFLYVTSSIFVYLSI